MKNKLFYSLLVTIVLIGSGCLQKSDKQGNAKITNIKKKDTKQTPIDEDIEEFELMDEIDGNFFVDQPTSGDTSIEGEEFAWVDIEDEQVPNEILFDFNRSGIRSDQQKTLNESIQWSKKSTSLGNKIVVEGHADAIGARDYNLGLSEQRAKVVAHELIYAGVPQDSVKIVGRGQEIPKVNAPLTPVAQQPNRRVVIYEIK